MRPSVSMTSTAAQILAPLNFVDLLHRISVALKSLTDQSCGHHIFFRVVSRQ